MAGEREADPFRTDLDLKTAPMGELAHTASQLDGGHHLGYDPHPDDWQHAYARRDEIAAALEERLGTMSSSEILDRIRATGSRLDHAGVMGDDDLANMPAGEKTALTHDAAEVRLLTAALGDRSRAGGAEPEIGPGRSIGWLAEAAARLEVPEEVGDGVNERTQAQVNHELNDRLQSMDGPALQERRDELAGRPGGPKGFEAREVQVLQAELQSRNGRTVEKAERAAEQEQKLHEVPRRETPERSGAGAVSGTGRGQERAGIGDR